MRAALICRSDEKTQKMPTRVSEDGRTSCFACVVAHQGKWCGATPPVLMRAKLGGLEPAPELRARKCGGEVYSHWSSGSHKRVACRETHVTRTLRDALTFPGQASENTHIRLPEV